MSFLFRSLFAAAAVLLVSLFARAVWHGIKLESPPFVRSARPYSARRSRLAAVLIALAMPIPVQAASFDCQQAGTSVEKMICADQELSRKDEMLDSVYTEIYGRTADTYALRAEQRKWLNRRSACPDTDCIAKAYRTRIAELEEIKAKPAPCFSLLERDWPTVKSGHYPVCVDFLENLNRFCDEPPPTCERKIDPAITSLSLPKWEELDPKEHLDLIGQILTPNYRFTKQWRPLRGDVKERILRDEGRLWHAWIDLDGDEVKEHVARFGWATCVPGTRTKAGSFFGVNYSLAVLTSSFSVDVRYGYISNKNDVILNDGLAYLLTFTDGSGKFSLHEPFHEPVTEARDSNSVCVFLYRD